MKLTILPGAVKGSVNAIASKSHLHRLLICAALADKDTLLRCSLTDAEDITATISCLSALGAKMLHRDNLLIITPIDRDRLPDIADLPCNESGSTLRFMLPVVSALGIRGRFHMSGRLPQRPLAPLDEELSRHGVRIWRRQPEILCCEGGLIPGEYFLPGDISSQYVTGLLLALPLLNGDSSLNVKEPIESEDYIAMTLDAIEEFGRSPSISGNRYEIRGGGMFISPGDVNVEGDWSNAAFWLCAGAMPGGDVRLRGLKGKSSQGDKEVCAVLERMGARVSWEGDVLCVSEGVRRGVEIDARAIPDLVPVLSAVAAVSQGTTVIKNAARLRFKESDRLAATAQTLNALGARVSEEADGLKIQGVPRLSGGNVDSWGDHRIAMTAAVASTACGGPVSITGSGAVKKSYPQFWDKLSGLGKKVIKDE